MLKEPYAAARTLLTLVAATHENTADIKRIRNELRTLASSVERIWLELEHLRKTEQQEREKMALRLENYLLRFERRLPPGRGETQD